MTIAIEVALHPEVPGTVTGKLELCFIDHKLIVGF